MTDFQVYFFPTIIWNIKGVTEFCKRKTSYFESLGVKWKLKFTYNKSVRGKICQVYLKRYGDGFEGDLKVSTMFCGINQFPQKVRICATTMDEWLIWEKSVSTMLKPTAFFTIEEFLNIKCLQCEIAPTTDWIETELPCMKQDEGKSPELPTCVTSLCSDFGKLFNNHVMSDVILACGDRKIYAHRNILSTRSDVFAAMFQTDMRESKERTVEIEDVEPSVLEQLVRYMYSGELPDMTEDSVYQLYTAADRYRVEALKIKCAIFMVDHSEATYVSPDAKAAVESSCGSLKKSALTHFANVGAVISSEEWKQLSEKEPNFARKALLYFVSESPI